MWVIIRSCYWSEVQWLFNQTPCCGSEWQCQAAALKYGFHQFPATVHQSFPNSTELLCSGSVHIPYEFFSPHSLSHLMLIPCLRIFFEFSCSAHKNCPINVHFSVWPAMIMSRHESSRCKYASIRFQSIQYFSIDCSVCHI